MNSVSCLLSLALLASFLPGDNALKCSVKTCSTQTVAGAPPMTQCQHPEAEITCKSGFDHCSTIRQTMKQPGMTIVTEMKNCSMSVPTCNPSFCDTMNASGIFSECKIDCCQGDLCNSGGPITTLAPTPSRGPSGSDLTCYSCRSSNFNASDAEYVADAECDSPHKQTCGAGVLPGTKQDQCRRMKLKRGGMEYEMRNCSDAMFCNAAMACAMMNKTGDITECNVKCCYGNLCNVEQPHGAASALLTGLLPYLLMMLVTVIVLQADII